MRKYEMEIDSVQANTSNARRVVILKQKGHDRYVPIWIGGREAEAIVDKLLEKTTERPLPHDILCEMVEKLGGKIARVVITEVREGIVYADIIIECDGREIVVDARPSDALAISACMAVPIYASEDIIATMSEEIVLIEREFDAQEDKDEQPCEAAPNRDGKSGAAQLIYPVGKMEQRKLSAFSKFVDSLDLKSELEKLRNELTTD